MPDHAFFASDADLVALHGAALQILAHIGIRTDHAGLCDRLVAAGCRAADGRIFIPEALVERLRAGAPQHFDLYGRTPDRRITVGAGRTCTTNCGIFATVTDAQTGRLRPSTGADVTAAARILDALPHTDVVYVSLFDATDAPPERVTLTDFALTLRNTTKPLIGPGVTSRAEARAVVAMAQAVRGGDPATLRAQPLCAPFICPITPLTFPAAIVDALEVVAEAGLPLLIIPNPVMGLTAPNTLAGAVALGHAEMLAALVMAQLVAPGLPVIDQNTPSVADMRSLTSTTGGPEAGLIRRTVAELSAFLGIPACVHGHTSSAAPDWQAGDEKALNTLLLASARPALLGGQGALANVTTGALEVLVLDDERFAALRRILAGITVDAEHLAFDVVADLVRTGAALDHPHTRRHLRSGETWQPRFALRRPTFPGEARQDSVTRARAEVTRLLATHMPPPLPEAVDEALTRILAEYAPPPAGRT